MKIHKLILFAVLIINISSQENNYVRELNPFLITHNGTEFSNIFSGGLNNPEFQFVDIDDDNDNDLFILNSDGSYDFFENIGNKFLPEFLLSFNLPQGLEFYDWFYFVDIDNDNDLDYFTGLKGSKVKYFQNIGTTTSPLFELSIDTVKNFLGIDLNVETGSNPAFADIDTDGDYDLICGNTSGTANYYENIGNPTQFLFDSLDNEWQNLRVGLGKTAAGLRHGASSIDFVDINNNGTLDLFWGDFFNTSLYLIRNNGTPFEPMMNIESRVYPLNADSISTKGFNMPRFIDIDGDNDLDLFSSMLWNDITTKRSISYRVNNGSNDFQFVTDNYLNLLDVGSRSIPDLVDIDADGDLDLFVGSESLTNPSIFYFENIGSALNPSFTLSDSNYFEISGDLSLSPTFGDLDADGDYDLLVGTFNDVIFYENTGTQFLAQFENRGILQNNLGQDLNAGIYARIRLFDVDNDNDLDLIAGNFNGDIILFRNIGTEFNYSFERDDTYFSIQKPGNYTNPVCYDYDNDGINELFVGTNEAKIFFYENDNNFSPNFVLSDSKFLDYSLGKEPNLFFCDIENDGDADLIIGNIKGGLYFYRNNQISSVNEETIHNGFNISVKSYPNPFNGSVQIEVTVPNNLYFSLKIFNILGEEVSFIYNGISNGEVQKFVWNTSNVTTGISSGTYIISVQTEGRSKNLPVLYLK